MDTDTPGWMREWLDAICEFCAGYLLPALLVVSLFSVGLAFCKLARAADPQLLCWSWPANEKAAWYRVRVDGRLLPVMLQSNGEQVVHCEATASWNIKCAEVRAISRRWEGWDSAWSTPCCGKIGASRCLTEEEMQ